MGGADGDDLDLLKKLDSINYHHNAREDELDLVEANLSAHFTCFFATLSVCGAGISVGGISILSLMF